MTKLEETLYNTKILFELIENGKPKMCIVKGTKCGGLYHLYESRDLTDDEIIKIFFGLGKWLERQKCKYISDDKEVLKFSFEKVEERNND